MDQTNVKDAETPFLDYYSEKKIIPVRQDIQDLRHHFARREGLYRQLGFLPSTFRGNHVLEFGPGSGDDAVHTASYSPAKYVMVDGNPYSIAAIQDKISNGILPNDCIECVESEIMSFNTDTKFDVVLAEGIVPGQKDSSAFLQHLSSFVAPDGVLMATTHSASSILAETCRRLFKPVLAQTMHNDSDMLAACLNLASPHLSTLKGMNRLHEDWILDTILHPWKKEVAFTIPMAINALDKNFDVLGTSPKFFQDWRWYKSIPTHEHDINRIVTEECNRWGFFFLDYRVSPDSINSIPDNSIESLCQQAFDIHFDIWESNDLTRMADFLAVLKEMADGLLSVSELTANSITDYIHAMQAMLNGDLNPDFKSFASWFGRGQQYVSFVNKKLSLV